LLYGSHGYALDSLCQVSLSTVFSLSPRVSLPVVVLASLVVACYLLVSYVVVCHIDGVCFKADEEEDEGNGCADCMDERVSMC